jgi:hypothetical protein
MTENELICAIFQVPEHFVYGRSVVAICDEYITMLLWATNGGWRGDRRPETW